MMDDDQALALLEAVTALPANVIPLPSWWTWQAEVRQTGSGHGTADQ